MNDEEDMTAELLRLAGARVDAPADRASRVRAAVYGDWQSRRRHRAMRKRAAIVTGALAAAAALILIVRSLGPWGLAGPTLDATVAIGERIEGEPLVRRPVEGQSRTLPLSLHMPLRADDVIETDHASRVALRGVDGSSIRFDRVSRARVVAPAVIELIDGAVYIATGDGSNGFEVRTPLATVRDVGTQFEVRLVEASLRVRVRTGLVEIHRGDRVIPAGAATEATVTSFGIESRSMAAYGSEWEWTAGLASSYKIEGGSLAAYLDYLSKEEGWTLRYADPPLAKAAATIILHGSVEGLRPEEALGVALATSGLTYRLRDGELLVLEENAR